MSVKLKCFATSKLVIFLTISGGMISYSDWGTFVIHPEHVTGLRFNLKPI